MATNNSACSGIQVGIAIRGGEPTITVRASPRPRHARPPAASLGQPTVFASQETVQGLDDSSAGESVTSAAPTTSHPTGSSQPVLTSQPTFQANPHCINRDQQLPQLLKDLQQNAVDILQEHEFDCEKVWNVCGIITNYLKGDLPPLSDNHEPVWSNCIENFVDKLREIADHRIDPTITKQVLEDLRLKIEAMIVECLKVNLSFRGYNDRRRFYLKQFKGQYINPLQRAYFNERFTELVCTLSEDLRKKDGTPLSREEQTKVSDFIQIITASLTITLWMEFEQIVALFDKNSFAPIMTMTIAVTSKPPPKRGSKRILPDPDILMSELTATLGRMDDPDGTIQRLFMAATNQPLEEVLIEEYSAFRQRRELAQMAGSEEDNKQLEEVGARQSLPEERTDRGELRGESSAVTAAIVKQIVGMLFHELEKTSLPDRRS